MRITRSTCALLALVSGLMAATPAPQKSPETQAAAQLVTSLSNPDGDVRANAAEKLRALAKDPSKLPGWHGHEYWEARVAKLRPGMSRAEVAAALWPELPADQREKDREVMAIGAGRTEIRTV